MALSAIEKQTQRLVGTSVRSVRAKKVLFGKTCYIDDLKLPNMLYLSFLRSSNAHARILHTNLVDVQKESGIVATFGSEDILEHLNPFPVLYGPEGLKECKRYPMIADKIARYNGEIIACFVGANRYVCEDALDLASIDYERLPVVNDAEKALEDNSPLLYESWGTNEAYSLEINSGDPDSAFTKADLILSEKFKVQRQYGSSMETRGVVASFDSTTGILTIHTSTQWPHVVRSVISEVLGMSENKIRVIAPDVGGGFGNKQDVYPEEVLCAYLSMKLKKPLKWIAARSEDFISTVHAREQIHYLQVAVDKNGILLGVRDRIIADLGAFHIMSIGPQVVTSTTLTGPYRIRNLDVKLSCVVTNKTPVGAYRGYGASESNFVIERAVDIISRQLKLDPVKVRLANFIKPQEFPYEIPTGLVYDNGNYPECLSIALDSIEYYKFRRKQRDYNRAEGTKRIGIGISFCVEHTGAGPTKQMVEGGIKLYGSYESATIRFDRKGGVTLTTSLCSQGQDIETTLAQVCADELGLALDDITVLFGDTGVAPHGFGTWGSRSAITGSSVVRLSCSKILEKASRIAARRLNIDEKQIRFSAGEFFDLERSHHKLSIKEVASLAYAAEGFGPGLEPGLEATSYYDPIAPSFSFQAHVPIVEVDTATGDIRILRYLVSHDCGVMINPSVVDGQVHGGVTQGIAGALFEKVEYDSECQLLTSSFMDYLVPVSFSVPNIEIAHSVTPSTVNSLGIKGMAEGGTIASAAAIANAVEDALSSLKIKIRELPITPEIVLQQIK